MSDMNIERRHILKGLLFGATAGTLLTARTGRAASGTGENSWADVGAAFGPFGSVLNLNNAAVSPQPKTVRDALARAYQFANELPDVNMWDVLDAGRDRTKEKLARMAGCKPQEIALNRNATEGLCTAIFGIDLAAGDEVVLSDWDYESMRNAWKLRAQRHGVVLKTVSFDALASDDEIIGRYRSAITARTKVLHMTHMVHYTGRVLPVEQLCALARAAGDIQTIVDAAQSFAQIPLSFERIGCDYLAASLHKWLCAPFGTGMLIVKQARIDALWPLLGPLDEQPQGLAKMDGWNLGTYSSPSEHAIEAAIDYHDTIGTQAKHARLRELSQYWIARASDIRGFKLHTPMADPQTAAVTLFSIDGFDPEQLEKRLRSEHNVRVRFRKHARLTGVRVSPHIYTREADLERFASALRRIVTTA
jgi:selenocysteine lyase/cysteine desulfurase